MFKEYFFKNNQSSEVLLIKAQILFDKTDFEHSLLYFCRAARISPRNKYARDGMNKCHKTIENKLSRTTFQIPKLSKILESYLNLRNNEKINPRSITYASHERCENLNKDHIKLISIEKDFLQRTRNMYKIPGSPDMFNILSDSENFLNSRLEFWSQI